MFDKEIEAIAKCSELLKELEDEQRVRVIKYLIERFGIGQSGMTYNAEPKRSPEEDVTYEAVPVRELDEPKAKPKVTDLPTLKDLLIKNYPKVEVEWILCYAYYASNKGNDTFTKEDLVNGYKANNRYSSSAKANLSNNIKNCVKKDWIKSINDTEFIMKDEGKNYANEVVQGNSTAKERKSTSRQKKED